MLINFWNKKLGLNFFKNQINELDKKIKEDKKKRRLLSEFLNEKLSNNALITKIQIDEDVQIRAKNSNKIGMVLSNAEIRILSILKFIFNNKHKDLLVFDDPISSFDSINIYYFVNLIDEINKEAEKPQILIFTHSYNLFQQFNTHSYKNNILFQQFKKEKNNIKTEVFKKSKSINKSKIERYIDLLNQQDKNIEIILPLIRQILEYLSSIIKPRGEMKNILQMDGTLKFAGISYEPEMKLFKNIIQDLVHKQSDLSHNIEEQRENIINIKKEIIKFLRKIQKS